jgi:putative peptidoglycan lipid II flippase
VTSTTRRSSALVSAGILLSRISGLVRERAVGHFLGLSPAANAFAYAFRIPNVLQNLLGEGVLSASFIPVHVALLDEGRDADARRLAGTVLGLLSAVAGAAALLMVLASGPIATVLVPGKDAAFRELVASLLRIVAPGLALLVVSAWCLGVLNSHRRFFLSYVAPVVWNLAQVVVLVAAGFVLLDDVTQPCGPTPGLGCAADPDVLAALAHALAWGTLVGGALQVLVQLPSIRRLTPGVRPSLGPIGPHVRQVVRAFVPVVIGRGVVQLATFVDLVLASLLAGAALATLQKVTILAVLPVSLFGMAVAAAELPELSSAGARDLVAVRRRVATGLERAAFYVLPTVIGFVVLGDVIIGALFQTGAFGSAETRLVWVVLIGATAGLLATTSSRLLQSVLYGGGDTRSPARIAIARVTLSTLLGLVLMFQFDRFELVADGGIALAAGADLPAFGPLPQAVRDLPDQFRLGALGLTAASAVGAVVEYRLLRELVESRIGGRVRVGGPSRGRLLVAGLVATAAAVLVRPVATDLTPFLGGLLGVTAVATAHILAGLALGLDEARALWATVASRVTR